MHALHFLMISRGKSSQNQRISSLDGLKSLKTSLNQYVEEKKSCLIFNFRLETCVTSGKWSPGRSTRAPGRKIFEIIQLENFYSSTNFKGSKLNENGLKSICGRKEKLLNFQFQVRGMCNNWEMVTWKAKQGAGKKNILK